jgi:hypothetical protein
VAGESTGIVGRGLVGRIQRGRAGTFPVRSPPRSSDRVRLVDVYALEVEAQASHRAEACQRLVRRCDLATALALVASPGLSVLIDHFMACELRYRGRGARMRR